MSTVASAPPVRHGLCRLTLRIGGTSYRLRRPAAGAPKGYRIWVLRALDGQRAGIAYAVATHQRTIGCTCPDHEKNGATCKHIRSLQALGIAPRVPTRTERDARRLARDRRRHKPILPDDSADGPAARVDRFPSESAAVRGGAR